MKKMSYRLGLDVGTNSLGWSVLALDEKGKPRKIEAAGARIFTDGRNPNKTTLKADRRDARSMRRRRDRFLQRQRYLMAELQRAGLFPESAEERKKLQDKNPLQLRARALKEKLSPYEIGRALFHLNQRRGFLSNRKDQSKEAREGVVAQSHDALLAEMGLLVLQPKEEKFALSQAEEGKLSTEQKKEIKKQKKLARQKEEEGRANALDKLRQDAALSYGAFLWKRQRAKKTTRARRGGGEDAKLYDVYPMRALYKDEFDKICKKQREYHSEILSQSVCGLIRDVIFFQRPLKPQKRGDCIYFPGEERAYRAMPSFQLFRIYKEVNNLRWFTSAGARWLREDRDVRNRVVELLKKPTTKGETVGWTQIKKLIKEIGLAEGDIWFNFETEKRDKGLECDLTSRLMRDENCVGAQWDGWSLDKKDEFINAIFEQVPDERRPQEKREQTDEEVCKRLKKDFGLSGIAATNCLNARFPDGTASLSTKAARLLADKMRDNCCQEDKAVAAVMEESKDKGFNPYGGRKDGEKTSRLPYYGKAFQKGGHIIPGTGKKEDAHDELKFYGGVTNPTVHIALNQIRLVVNELIARYGKPFSVAIELGRELPQGAAYRRGIASVQAANQKKNEKLKEDLREAAPPIPVTRENLLRLQLWKEQGHVCPYSGRTIGFAMLFTREIEVDHIVPFSVSLDDGRANKVVCLAQANQYKGNKTPFQAFGNSPDGYDWHEIYERASAIKYEAYVYNQKKESWVVGEKSKIGRFEEDALERFDDDGDFLSRHLNDTRYIGRLAKEYLEGVCSSNKIDVLTGRLTALLRKHWGLNSVLPDADDKTKKNRNDHRHHAVDAVVIGMTSRSMLQKVSTAANQLQGNEEDLLARSKDGSFPIDPWDDFRNDVKSAVAGIVVSHKIQSAKSRYKQTKSRKMVRVSTDGQLHNDTAYGLIDEGKVVSRKTISWFDKPKQLDKIRDSHLRKEFKTAFDAGGKEGVESLARERGIRSLRCVESLKVIPIKDRHGKDYKAYKGDSNWGVEIYEYPKGHKKAGQWEAKVISQFDAHRPDFALGRSRRPHPDARLIMRLRANDCVMFDGQLIRLHKFSQDKKGNKLLYFVPLHEANVDARDRKTRDLKKKKKKNPNMDVSEIEQNDSFSYLNKSISQLQKFKARKVCVSAAGRWSFEKPRKK